MLFWGHCQVSWFYFAALSTWAADKRSSAQRVPLAYLHVESRLQPLGTLLSVLWFWEWCSKVSADSSWPLLTHPDSWPDSLVWNVVGTETPPPPFVKSDSHSRKGARLSLEIMTFLSVSSVNDAAGFNMFQIFWTDLLSHPLVCDKTYWNRVVEKHDDWSDSTIVVVISCHFITWKKKRWWVQNEIDTNDHDWTFTFWGVTRFCIIL